MAACRRQLLALTLAASTLAACGGEVQPGVVSLPLPQALQVSCATAPVDLSAQLWVSGRDAPCTLSVDQVAGTTSGQCDVAAGRERTLTVDWYVERDGTRVLLAQARQTIDLAGATDAEQNVNIAEGDITVTDCLDVRDDKVDGVDTQRFDGVDVPVCDLDDSCGGALAADCSNLGELCAGEDPLLP